MPNHDQTFLMLFTAQIRIEGLEMITEIGVLNEKEDEDIQKRFMAFPLKKRKAMEKLRKIAEQHAPVTITQIMDVFEWRRET